MSDTPETPSDSPTGLLALFGERDERFKLFVKIAAILGVVTCVEIGILFMHLSTETRVFSLVVLSIAKFALVVYIFMHLRWDKLFCTLLFLIGLSLAAGTITALVSVFRVKDSVPLSAATAASTTLVVRPHEGGRLPA